MAQKITLASLLLVGVVISWLVLSVDFVPHKAQAAVTDNVTGWLWSDTVGWVSANCTGDSSCTINNNYGVTINQTTGDISGYMWSEHLGWISFNRAETNNPPQAPYNSGSGSIARYDSATGKITGWARVLSGCENVAGIPVTSCASTSAGANSLGFDGWISLSDPVGTSYGLTVDNSTGDINGYAWGSLVVGWLQTAGLKVDFSLVSGNINATPCEIAVGGSSCPSTITWTANNFSGTPSVRQEGVGFSSASNGSEIRPINPDEKVFSLRDGGSSFSVSVTAVVACVSGSAWNGDSCEIVGSTAMGNINATSCNIAVGGSSCQSTVSWTSSGLSSPSIRQGGVQFSTNPNNSGISRAVTPTNRTFRLYDGGDLVDTATAGVGCAGGAWSGVECATAPVISLDVNPDIIRSGNRAKIEIDINSTFVLTCTLRGANNPADTFTHDGNATANGHYEITTRELTSRQKIDLECTSASGVGGTASGWVDVLPLLQEI